MSETAKDEICVFANDGKTSFCKILVGEKCDGRKKRCSFWKTEEQFNTERDKAIAVNRERGNCQKCRYMGVYCRTSAEETVVDNFF